MEPVPGTTHEGCGRTLLGDAENCQLGFLPCGEDKVANGPAPEVDHILQFRLRAGDAEIIARLKRELRFWDLRVFLPDAQFDEQAHIAGGKRN